MPFRSVMTKTKELSFKRISQHQIVTAYTPVDTTTLASNEIHRLTYMSCKFTQTTPCEINP